LPDWERWCKTAGVDGIDLHSGQHFPDSLLAVQAALAGQGVALVSLVLVADALAAGLLVRPCAVTLPGETYHFVCAESLEASPGIGSLRSWFVQQLANEPRGMPNG
jgi:LysR family glycine cleavage system transcriptional activator